MAFVIKLIYIKPENAVWFSQSKEPLLINDTTTTAVMALKDFDRWNKDQPGYIASFGKPIALHSVEAVYIFDNEENGQAWNTARKSHPFQQAQDEYFSNAGISVVETTH